MRNWRKVPTTFWHLFIVTLLGLPLVMPLMRWTSVPCTHDGHLHVHRVAAMRHAWENGLIFTRWLPDLAFGYGYPFFVYREPMPLYAVMVPHLLGVPMAAASNLFYAFCILSAGWFMFLWVNDLAGTRAGLVSAVAYMAAPYVLIDALIRGNAPESLALPLFPFLLWVGRRWILHGSVKMFLLSVFGLAFLSLSHNISIFIFTPFFLLYLVSVGWLHNLSWRPLLVKLLLLFGLGLGMTIFYTGGALLEMDEVTLSQSTVTRNNDFHFNFASWTEILAPVAAEDPTLLNPPLPIRLGWVPVALAIIGLSTLFWRKLERELRWHVLMMAAATALFLFMALPVSLTLWENIPLIDFIQFPWRFIGRAALPVAFLAGMPFAVAADQEAVSLNRRKHVLTQIALGVAISLLLLEALPNLYPRYCREDSFPTILDVHAYEQATGLVGIDPEGSYFPRTVEQRPKGSPLQADYQAGQSPQRFDMSLLPQGATAVIAYGPLSASGQINAPVPFTARYLSFAFPGWEVHIDDQRVPIIPSDPEGLITFAVPAGEHVISIRWQSTLTRTALSLVSFLSLLAVGLTTVVLIRRSRVLSGNVRKQQADVRPYWPLVVLAIGLLLLKVLVIDNRQTIWRRSAAPPVQQQMAMSAAEMSFEGYNLSDTSVASGETFDIDLAWRLLAPTENRYQSNVWIVGQEGLLWSDKDTHRPRIFEDAPPTREWANGQWAWDSREVAILSGTPPGMYDIVLTLFDFATQQPLTLYDAQGVVIGPTAVIGQIAVGTPKATSTVAPQFLSGEIVPGTGLTLLGYNLGRETMAPGAEILLTLFWQRGQDPVTDSFDLQLMNDVGEAVQSWRLPVTRADYALSKWQPDQPLRSQYLLRLRGGLDSGVYEFRLPDGISAGQVEVNAPERVFDAPEMAVIVNQLFGDHIELAGYSLTTEPLKLELIWMANDEVDKSYHVFVHLVDEDGQIVAQTDGQPASWTRPTTGWAPGEYVVDTHTLSLPHGISIDNLSLRVGLYDPGSGERLPVDGSDFATLTEE